MGLLKNLMRRLETFISVNKMNSAQIIEPATTPKNPNKASKISAPPSTSVQIENDQFALAKPNANPPSASNQTSNVIESSSC